GNLSNQLISKPQEATDEVAGTSKQIRQLIGQELTAAGGYLITLREEDGKLQADMRANLTQGIIYKNLSVAIEKDINLAAFPYLDKRMQQCRIHVQVPKSTQKGCVFLFNGGLSGGMKRQRTDNQKEKDGDRRKKFEKEKRLIQEWEEYPFTQLTLEDLPEEIL